MDVEAGDLVRLVSTDDRLMNVKSVLDGTAICTWFDFAGRRHTDPFLVAALVIVAKVPRNLGRHASPKLGPD